VWKERWKKIEDVIKVTFLFSFKRREVKVGLRRALTLNKN
jgi:hypothetical protein